MSDRSEHLRQSALLHRNQAKELLAKPDRTIFEALDAIAHATLAMEAQIERASIKRSEQ